VTALTSPSLKLTAELAATFSSRSIQPIQRSLQLHLLATTGPSTRHATSYVMSWPPPPKPKSVPSSSTVRTQFPCANSTAAGFANNTINQKRSKAMEMRFYWNKDQVEQGQFLIYWRPGSENLGDYFTKHHSPSHHRLMRPVFLHPTPTQKPSYSDALRGCVNSASVCAPNSAPRLVRLTGVSASVCSRNSVHPTRPTHK
jgi:hypothetical protein